MRKFVIFFVLLLGISSGLTFSSNDNFQICGIIATDDPTNGTQVVSASDGIDLDTQFLIGSVSKQITGFLIARFLSDLEEDIINHLSKADLRELISEVVNMDRDNGASDLCAYNIRLSMLKSIKIRHLIQHTTGIDFKIGKKFANPGESFSYDNFNYVLLGRILENVAGCPYATICEKLFHEAGMGQSYVMDDLDFTDLRKKFPKLEPSLRIFSNLSISPKGRWSRVLSPAGGIVSSARDLLLWNRFWEANHGKVSLPEVAMGNGSVYGLGVIKNSAGISLHDGQVIVDGMNYSSLLIHNTTNGKSCVILENAPSREETALRLVQFSAPDSNNRSNLGLTFSGP